VPTTGLLLRAESFTGAVFESAFWPDTNFVGLDFLIGVSLEARGFLGLALELRVEDLGVGVVGLFFPFASDLFCVMAPRDRELPAGVADGNGTFFFCSDCRCEYLVGRVGVELLPCLDEGRNTGGIGFVRPDLRRPSSPMNDAGVWVVALFHGGESSNFLFLEGGLISEPPSWLIVEAVGSGVVCPFSAKTVSMEAQNHTSKKNGPGEPDGPGRFRVLPLIQVGLVGFRS
jgi:hypothetical protein